MKKSIVWILLAAMLLLAGCKDPEVVKPGLTEAGTDYNDYVVWSGEYAWTADGVYFLKNGILFFLDENQNDIPLCGNPQCSHQNSACSAFLGTTAIYASNEHLYYMADSSEGQLKLYQMSLLGTERQVMNNLAVLEDCSNVATSYQIAGEHFVLKATVSTTESAETTIYSASLEKNAPLSPIFTDLDQDLTVLSLMHTTDKWVFAIAQDTNLSCHIVGYEFAACKSYDLFQIDPSRTGNVNIRPDGAFVWSVMNEGIYQMRLGETPSLLCTVQDWEQGVAVADDQYFYLSNMAAARGADTIPAEQTGVSIYSLTGEPVDFLPAEDIAGALSYAFSTEQYVYFYDFYTGNGTPVCYLDKSELGTDALHWHILD